jgi:CSLREA domain-containing protein
MPRSWSFLMALSLSISSVVCAAGPTFAVNSTADAHDANVGNGICAASGGACTLRAAVEEANHTTGALILVPAGMFTLMLGSLPVTSAMTITGAGVKATVVNGNNADRVFFNPGPMPGTAPLTITDMTLENGHTAADGGVIATPNLVTMERCLVMHGSAAFAGCIHANTVSFIDVAMTDCQATNGGGGCLYASSVGTVLTRTTIWSCSATGPGGGVAAANVTLVNSTLSGNHAGGVGGGAWVPNAVFYVYSSTIAGNLSDATRGGGGIAASSFHFVDTLFANNYDSNGQMPFPALEESECAGTATNDGHSIMLTDGAPNCTLSGSAVTLVDNAAIGPLQDNGGYAPTRALLAGSPAIDAGNPGGCSGSSGTLTTDQRGVHRPIGSACDIGAYERSPCGDVNGDGAVNVADVFFLINSLFAGGALPPGLANVNADSAIDVGDVFYLINFLFAGGPAPSCPGT